jgi:hypothetical protein
MKKFYLVFPLILVDWDISLFHRSKIYELFKFRPRDVYLWALCVYVNPIKNGLLNFFTSVRIRPKFHFKVEWISSCLCSNSRGLESLLSFCLPPKLKMKNKLNGLTFQIRFLWPSWILFWNISGVIESKTVRSGSHLQYFPSIFVDTKLNLIRVVMEWINVWFGNILGYLIWPW